MVNTAKLKCVIVQKEMSHAMVAKAIGVTPQTFNRKMNRGVFGAEEINTMARLLEIDKPQDVFFASHVTF